MGATIISVATSASATQAIIWPSGDSDAWCIPRVFSSSETTLAMRGSSGEAADGAGKPENKDESNAGAKTSLEQ